MDVVVLGRFAHGSLEQAMKVKPAQPGQRRHFLQIAA
jgi:hypothetical protein